MGMRDVVMYDVSPSFVVCGVGSLAMGISCPLKRPSVAGNAARDVSCGIYCVPNAICDSQILSCDGSDVDLGSISTSSVTCGVAWSYSRMSCL